MTVAEAVAEPNKMYAWRAGARHPSGITPEEMAAEIGAIADKNGGICSPKAYVDQARDPDSKLHPSLTWDDALAGEEHRVHQARGYIRALVVVRQETAAPAYVHIKRSPKEPDLVNEGYMQIEIAMRQSDLRGQVLRETVSMLSGLRRRLVELQHVGAVVAALDQAIEEARKAAQEPGEEDEPDTD